MKLYNIVKPTKYTKDGEEKTRWDNVGTLKIFEKGGKIEIPAIGLEAQVLPPKNGTDVVEELTEADVPF